MYYVAMGRMDVDDRIKDRLVHLSRLAELYAADGKFSLHKNAENTVRDLLNLLYDEEFENVNVSKNNAAGFDLISSKSRTIFQVSSEYRSEKISSSIALCDEEKYNGYRLRFLFLVTSRKRLKKKNWALKHVGFNQSEDVLTLNDVSKIISNSKIEMMEKIDNLLQKEVGYTAPRVENEQALEQIILLLAEEDNDDSCVEQREPLSFEIIDKIKYNNLDKRTSFISDRCGSLKAVERVYDRFDKIGKNKSRAVSRLIHRIYIISKDEKTGVVLFDDMLNKLMESIEFAAGMKNIDYGDLTWYCDLLLTDAFVKCRVFENPNLKI